MGTVVARAMVLGATKMACYNEIKDFLKRVPNHPDPRYCASSLQVGVQFIMLSRYACFQEKCSVLALVEG